MKGISIARPSDIQTKENVGGIESFEQNSVNACETKCDQRVLL
jgi:hypothetical protein